MRRICLCAFLLSTALLDGCVALGWSFGPGISARERRDMFVELPVVEHRGHEYVLAWQQGAYPFFFQPSYQAIDGHLVFAMVATASSGNLAGRAREMRIEGAENVEALRRGGAFWWEPEPRPRGSLVLLRIVDPQRP